MDKLQFDGPVVLAVLDGVGLAPDGPGNAVSKARTLFLGQASQKYLHIALEASGEAVGLIPGQMGNSEVGHNTMGCGRAFKQGIARINEEFRTGKVFDSDAWRSVVTRLQHEESATLHFAGIFSDGGVHSHISHLEQMISKAYAEGIRKMRVHAVFDGRDVPPQSEPKFIKQLESFAQQFTDADIKIASGGGRMVCVADRYENDWAMVERGWNMMVNAKADYYFQSAEEAIMTLRRAEPNVQDQYLPAFVVVDQNERPIGKIEKGDALIYFDFRADRAIEIAQAFTYWDFPYFNRGNYTPDDVFFTKVDIDFRICSEDGNTILAQQKLTVSRSASELAEKDDGKIRLKADLSAWTVRIIVAAGLIWILAVLRIVLNRIKKKKEK